MTCNCVHNARAYIKLGTYTITTLLTAFHIHKNDVIPNAEEHASALVCVCIRKNFVKSFRLELSNFSVNDRNRLNFFDTRITAC